MTRKEKWNIALTFLCAIIWAGVACAWFLRAWRGTVGTPWFNAVLGLACLATAGVFACRGLRNLSRAKRSQQQNPDFHQGGKAR